MLRRKLWIGICVLLFLAGILLYLYRSAISGPEFYQAANSVDPDSATIFGGEFENEILQMHNSAVRESTWGLSVSDQQLNGWIQTHLKEKYAKFNPNQVENLCVSFVDKKIRIAFQLKNSYFPFVICVHLEPFMTAENDNIGLKLLGVYMGVIPLPTKKATDQITQALSKANIPVAWTSEGGKPVGILSPSISLSKAIKRKIVVQSISFEEDRVLISGTASDDK